MSAEAIRSPGSILLQSADLKTTTKAFEVDDKGSATDDVSRLKADLANALEDLRLQRGWRKDPPPPYRANTWREYLVLPLQQRGCVALAQIGIRHGTLDILLCACLGLPGLFFALFLEEVDCRVRALVAFESGITACTSIFGDGFLLERVLWFDKKVTAPCHLAIWIGLLVWFTVEGHVAISVAIGLVVLGLGSLVIFHARVYWVCVAMEPKAATICARLWHVAGTLVTAAIVLAAAIGLS